MDCESVHRTEAVVGSTTAVAVAVLAVQLWSVAVVDVSEQPRRERDVVQALARPTAGDASVVRSVH